VILINGESNGFFPYHDRFISRALILKSMVGKSESNEGNHINFIRLNERLSLSSL